MKTKKYEKEKKTRENDGKSGAQIIGTEEKQENTTIKLSDGKMDRPKLLMEVCDSY